MTTETVRVGVQVPISGGSRTLQSLRKIRTGSAASFGVGTVVSVSSGNPPRLDATLNVPVNGGYRQLGRERRVPADQHPSRFRRWRIFAGPRPAPGRGWPVGMLGARLRVIDSPERPATPLGPGTRVTTMCVGAASLAQTIVCRMWAITPP